VVSCRARQRVVRFSAGLKYFFFLLQSDRGAMLNNPSCLGPRLKLRGLYFHFFTCLHSVDRDNFTLTGRIVAAVLMDLYNNIA
jgi:hypothetical protein